MVKFAGLQKLSLVDYPGHLASTVFIPGCNFRCPYCQNPDLVEDGDKYGGSIESVLEFLRIRKDKIEGVVITGGEPVLQEDLPDLASEIKTLGLKVKLDTNGSDPEMLMHLMREKLVDYIAIDIKTSLRKYDLVVGTEDIDKIIEESVFFTILSTTPYEFRTTCVPGVVDEEDFKSLYDLVKGAKKYVLQQFRPEVTLDPRYKDIKPYPNEKLYKFRDILKEFVHEVTIRGI